MKNTDIKMKKMENMLQKEELIGQGLQYVGCKERFAVESEQRVEKYKLIALN